MISRKDAADFPFLKQGSAYVKSLSLDVFEDEGIRQMIDSYLHQVYASKQPGVFFENLDTETSIKRFLGCCIVLNQTHKTRMIAKFAEHEAYKYTHMLKLIYERDETPDKSEFYAYYSLVFQEIYGVANFVRKMKNMYAVMLVQYFRLVELGHKNDDPLALINLPAVKGGYVFFPLEILFEILRRRIKTYMKERIEKKMFRRPTEYEVKFKGVKQLKFYEPVPLPGPLVEMIKKYEILEMADAMITSKTRKGKNPPCVDFLMDKIRTKHELGHTERLYLAVFLKARGYTDDQVVDLYRDLNNFDENTTRYHLGSLDEYKVHSCKKVRDLGMCRPDGKRCREISNPYFY